MNERTDEQYARFNVQSKKTDG